MPTLIFRLRNVPDDEAGAVRALLDHNGFQSYETSAGNWGIATPAIWLTDGQDVARARTLIEDYQRTRATEQRAGYEALRAEGRHRRFRDVLSENPVRVILYLAFSAFLVYVSVRPFFGFGD